MDRLEFENLQKLALSGDPSNTALVKTILDGLDITEEQFFNHWGLSSFKIYSFEGLKNVLKNGLNAYNSGVQNLTPLANFNRLQSAYLGGNKLKSLETLPYLPQLETLEISKNPITSLGGIERAPSLKSIIAQYTELENITPISALERLETVNFYQSRIRDFSPLQNSPRLQGLVISNSQEVILSSLANLPINKLCYSEIKDFYPSKLPPLPNLTSLDLCNNFITKVENIEQYKNLRSLSLTGNFIRDLSGINGVENLTYLHVSNCDIESLEGIAHDKITFINLSSNRIKDLTPLQNIKNLENVHLSGNLYELDLTPLYKCEKLTNVKLDNHTSPQAKALQKYKPNCQVSNSY